MVAAKEVSMVGHDCGNGHVPAFLVLHPTWTISTYCFPVSCGVAEDHCLLSPQEKDEVEEVEKIWAEENAVVRAATLVAKKGRTSGECSVDQGSLQRSIRSLHLRAFDIAKAIKDMCVAQ
jgi:hypothetical protein